MRFKSIAVLLLLSALTSLTSFCNGSDWHQHGGAYSYGGLSPQGYLTGSGDKLIVPGGRPPGRF